MTAEDEAELHTRTDESLRRKAEQHWEMAGLAIGDGDVADYQRQTEIAKACDRILRERM